MMAQAAEALPLNLSLLAASSDDAAISHFRQVTFGSAQEFVDIIAFGRANDTITFDHELVNLEAVLALEDEGRAIFPSSHALRFAVDKAHQRTVFASEGLPTPDFVILEQFDEPVINEFITAHPEGVVVKSARGGYDGRGVVVLREGVDPRETITNFLSAGTVVLEERVALLAEMAVSIVTSRNGESVLYPVVDTVQRDGMCVEVSFPTTLPADVAESAERIARAVATRVNAVGVLAVELFATSKGVLINEVATRPHNSGHWTIEGTTVSQFENHLRAVAGLDLVSPTPTGAFVTMVNVIGTARPGDQAAAGQITGAAIHDYGKSWRPGRKLGHVTVVGDNRSEVAKTAWDAAALLQPSN
jgi:5-(carboxyamino)imidazole ribonucleotide synthase